MCVHLIKYSIALGAMFLVSGLNAAPDSRIILNGAYLIIAEGAQLVVENSSPDAITRIDGHIISEGENNIIRWNIGTEAADYVVPLGNNNDYFPLSFSTAAAVGEGYFNFSTYPTPWNNSSLLPAGITQVDDEFGVDNSAFVIDRFWQMAAKEYSTKPTLSNVEFTYLDSEHSASGNSITEGNLKMQRFDDIAMEWGGYPPTGTVNTTDNTVTLASLDQSELFSWWTMVDQSSPLPISLLSFTAIPEGSKVRVNWVTETEINNDFFTVARSQNGLVFETVQKVPGAVQSGVRLEYSIVDPQPWSGVSYYRLMQTDLDGKNSYSKIVSVQINRESSFHYHLYPNPTDGTGLTLSCSNAEGGGMQVRVFNHAGKEVYDLFVPFGFDINSSTTFNLPESLPEGVYLFKVDSYHSSSTKKVVLIR